MVHGGTPACRKHCIVQMVVVTKPAGELGVHRAPKGYFNFIYHPDYLLYDLTLSYLLKTLYNYISTHCNIEFQNYPVIFSICLWDCSYFIICMWRGFHTQAYQKECFVVFLGLRPLWYYSLLFFHLCPSITISLWLQRCRSSQPLSPYLVSLFCHTPCAPKTTKHS